ncbi:MAG: beta-galactosidase trimerization domain-containing protein, partial [Gemmataceae bacterium]
TNLADDYDGFKPYKVGTPFANEAIAATKLYMRFKNTSDKPAQLVVARSGHFQPQYGGATAKYPEQPVAPGQWSAWFNIGPFCRLVHDEGLRVSLSGAKTLAVQVARDAAGKDLVGDLTIESGDTLVIPIDITWKKDARVKTSKQLAGELVALSKSWRKANGGKKPQEILWYGAFSGNEDWVNDLKDALGYNTLLPDKYAHAPCDGLHAHTGSPQQIRAFAEKLADKKSFRVLSFGDEIGLGRVNFKDPKVQARFRDWLKARKVTQAELGVDPASAVPSFDGAARLVWYSTLFNEDERFASYRQMTELAKELIGPHVLTGANFSPHHLALYYGPVYQWVDLFKQGGMSLFWAEDYIFSVPEVPQIISWQFAQMRCGVKYKQQPIHFYVMPHAPGQEPGYLRRNLLLSVGYGARHINNFWVGPEDRFTENYVAWGYPDNFRALSEAIFDSAEAESLQVGGKVRPARVAVLLSKATDFNEARLLVDKSDDVFGRRCKNAPAKMNQILCRKEQQMLYLALRQAQYAVDLITEDDIVDGILKDYDVLYFAGEWLDNRTLKNLDAWIQAGGTFYACAGVGHLNQFNEPEAATLELLGLKATKLKKDGAVVRTLLELPLWPTSDTITVDGQKVPAIAMRQELTPSTAKVLGTWADGTAAVTMRELGKGRAFAVGTLPGNIYMKSGLKPVPFARGGRTNLYNPSGFDTAATKLVRLGLDASKVEPAVTTSQPLVEAVLIDHPKGTLLTLVNWTDQPIKGLEVSVKLPAAPKSVRSVALQKELGAKYAEGKLSFKLDLEEADFILVR